MKTRPQALWFIGVYRMRVCVCENVQMWMYNLRIEHIWSSWCASVFVRRWPHVDLMLTSRSRPCCLLPANVITKSHGKQRASHRGGRGSDFRGFSKCLLLHGEEASSILWRSFPCYCKHSQQHPYWVCVRCMMGEEEYLNCHFLFFKKKKRKVICQMQNLHVRTSQQPEIDMLAQAKCPRRF